VSETRERILATVESDPGIHFRGLVRSLDLAHGQVQYHVRELRGSDAVVAEDHRGRTHYYLPAYDPWERRAIAVLRRETARDVVTDLLERDERRPAGRRRLGRRGSEYPGVAPRSPRRGRPRREAPRRREPRDTRGDPARGDGELLARVAPSLAGRPSTGSNDSSTHSSRTRSAVGGHQDGPARGPYVVRRLYQKGLFSQ